MRSSATSPPTQPTRQSRTIIHMEPERTYFIGVRMKRSGGDFCRGVRAFATCSSGTARSRAVGERSDPTGIHLPDARLCGVAGRAPALLPHHVAYYLPPAAPEWARLRTVRERTLMLRRQQIGRGAVGRRPRRHVCMASWREKNERANFAPATICIYLYCTCLLYKHAHNST